MVLQPQEGRLMINVAVIGVGNIGYHHARNYAKIPNACLVAIAAPMKSGGAWWHLQRLPYRWRGENQ